MLTFYRRLRQNNTFISQTFDLKELYVIKTNIVIQIIVINAIEKYNPDTIRASKIKNKLKTLYQIKAFNLFFFMKFTS
jgi:hypothetical protein